MSNPKLNDSSHKNSDRIIYGLFKIFMEYTTIKDLSGNELIGDDKINGVFNTLNETLGKYEYNNVPTDVIIGIFRVNEPTIQTLEQVKD